MAKGDQTTYRGEDPCTGQKYSPGAQETTQIYGKGTNKHHGGVECSVDPGRFIDSEM
jgi:hypothetical protein